MSDGSSFPLDYGPTPHPLPERPVFHTDSFVDVSQSVTDTVINARFKDNPELIKLIPGWPNPDPKAFCLFAVPDSYKGPTLKHNVHIGMGRGISAMDPVIPGSLLAEKLKKEGSQSVNSVRLGVFDEETGMFYTAIGTKGNGPTAEEMDRLEGLVGGAEHRLKDENKTWGLYLAETADTLEKPLLDLLGQIGFRVSQVPGHAQLDGDALAQQIDPIYKAAGLNYSVANELAKAPDFNPGIMLRLMAGVKADVLNHPDANPELVTTGLYSFAEEIKNRGIEDFLRFYGIKNTNLRPDVEIIKNYVYPEPLTDKTARAYLRLLSFLMQRNFYLQDEYNDLKKDPKREKPLWLNFKPGDWDVGACLYDVDVFELKRDLARRITEEAVRKNDNEALGKGLQGIGQKLSTVHLPDWRESIVFGRQSAQFVHEKHTGFLLDRQNVPDFDFY